MGAAATAVRSQRPTSSLSEIHIAVWSNMLVNGSGKQVSSFSLSLSVSLSVLA